MAQIIVDKASSRGVADHGWLKSYQTFSFSGYYNPKKIQFGALRVLNDDIVDGGMGFGDHPHDNMEIISIPLEGELKHKDSMGNEAVIKPGEIQVMSAGTGIYHTEFNNDAEQPAKFLQIWVYPNIRNVKPRYDQIKLNQAHNQLHQILSPDQQDEGVWIYQDAWFHMGNFDEGKAVEYQLKGKEHGVYIFVISGSVEVDNQLLDSRDGMGIWDTSTVKIDPKTNSQFLLMEVPMKINL